MANFSRAAALALLFIAGGIVGHFITNDLSDYIRQYKRVTETPKEFNDFRHNQILFNIHVLSELRELKAARGGGV